MDQNTYEVIVGNVGTVYRGDSESQAMGDYEHYVNLSLRETGRASGEDVTMMENGEPVQEYIGSLNDVSY